LPFAAALALVLPAFVACTPAPGVQRAQGASMGTTWSAQFVAPVARRDEVARLVAAELQAEVAQMSAWERDSALSRFNRAEAGTWHAVPPGLFEVFSHALALARETGGAYDPTVGPLVNLWGFGPDGAPRSEPPSGAEIAMAQARVGHARIELDADAKRVLQPGSAVMDISSLGPGHALDRIAARLHAQGIDDFLVELGGEMIASGRKPGGDDWRIAVEPASAGPDGEPAYDLVLALRDAAAGSSGDYRVGFEHEGRRYSHTIDPRTGAPVRHALAGVTVIAAGAMEADAMAAALMVLGPADGFDFAQRRGVAAVLTSRDGAGYVRRRTPAFDALLRAP
jgi:thiamine biosynthesis lipoprotein